MADDLEHLSGWIIPSKQLLEFKLHVVQLGLEAGEQLVDFVEKRGDVGVGYGGLEGPGAGGKTFAPARRS
jgi:hypothetical protein